MSTPKHGTATLADGEIIYTPVRDFFGGDAIELTVSDGVSTTTANISISVEPVNDAPIAVADELVGVEDIALTFATGALLANDTDVDGDTLTVTAVSSSISGVVELVGTTITFTPANDFHGLARFTYTVSDGAVSASATVTITVSSVNDAPIAVNDVVSGEEDVESNIAVGALLANDTDVDGDLLTVVSVSAATNGTVALVGNAIAFTPTADFHGVASFAYAISDGTATATANVEVIIAPVNDAPIAVMTSRLARKTSR